MKEIEVIANSVVISKSDDLTVVEAIDSDVIKSSGGCRVKISGNGSVSCHNDGCGGSCELKSRQTTNGTQYWCECNF